MANVIRIKRRAAGGAAGAPASLKNAELAFNEQDGILYYGMGLSGVDSAAEIIPIAGSGLFITSHMANSYLHLSGGTLTGNLYGTGISGSTGEFGTLTVRGVDTDTRYMLSGAVVGGNWETSGTVASHVGDPDPHTQYLQSAGDTMTGTLDIGSQMISGNNSSNIYAGNVYQAGVSLDSTYIKQTAPLQTILGDLIISGNFYVSGTYTYLSVQDLLVTDKNIILGNVGTPSNITAEGGGITLLGDTNKTFSWLGATDSWTSSENIDLAGGKVYKIGGTTVLSSSGLGSGVTHSELTSFGNVTSGTLSNVILLSNNIIDCGTF